MTCPLKTDPTSYWISTLLIQLGKGARFGGHCFHSLLGFSQIMVGRTCPISKQGVRRKDECLGYKTHFPSSHTAFSCRYQDGQDSPIRRASCNIAANKGRARKDGRCSWRCLRRAQMGWSQQAIWLMFVIITNAHMMSWCYWTRWSLRSNRWRATGFS